MSRINSCLALLVAALGACTGAAGDQHLDVVFDVCQPIAVVAPGASDAQLTGIQYALELWQARGVAMAAVGGDTVEKPAIEVRFAEAAPAFHGVYEDEIGVIYVNSGLEDPRALAITISHELGHAFGLGHVDAGDRASVRNPGNLSIEPNAGDADAIAALWGRCP